MVPPPDSLPTPWTCLLIQTESSTVLIDTGVGEGTKSGGKLLTALTNEGLSAEDIDIVILTHIHADHIGGCTREDGQLTFPNATYVMAKNEWEFWTTEASLKTAPEWIAKTSQRVLPALSDRMRVVEDQSSIVPGICVLAAPGHTFEHMAVEITSEGERLIYLADTALHPIHVEYPHWTAVVDQFPEQTVQTRLSLYERVARLKSLVLVFHFDPFPSLGYIVREEDGWRWQSIDMFSQR